MIFDTNFIIHHIRRQVPLPGRVIIPIIVVGELEAFSLNSDCNYQKINYLLRLLDTFPVAKINRDITRIYVKVDAFSQARFAQQPLPPGLTARNMGKNNLCIAAIGLYLDLEVHTKDHDFTYFTTLGLWLVLHADS